MKYWLMKTEPNTFSIDDLRRKNRESWDGVRNFQVRNMIRDEIRVGDMALMYHSSAGDNTGVVGIMEVVKDVYPDPTQFDPLSDYADLSSDPMNPRWFCFDVKFKEKFERLITLRELKNDPKLKDFRLVKKGNRLSIMPVTKGEFDYIIKLAKAV